MKECEIMNINVTINSCVISVGECELYMMGRCFGGVGSESRLGEEWLAVIVNDDVRGDGVDGQSHDR